MKDSGVEWIGEIPKYWDTISLKHVIQELINGYSFSSDELGQSQQYPVIRIGDIQNEIICIDNALKTNANEDRLEKYIIKNNDILMALSGLTVGKMAFVDKITETAFINQRVGILRSKINKFLFYWLSTKYFLDYIILESSGTAQPNISNSILNDFVISIPNNKNELTYILNYLDNKCSKIDYMIEKQQAIIEKLKEYKQSLIIETITKGLNSDVTMKDSGIEWIGKIPENSIIVKLKRIVSKPITDGTHITPTYDNKYSGSPFLSSKDVSKGYIDWTNIKYIT